jgi:hypothetical protein
VIELPDVEALGYVTHRIRNCVLWPGDVSLLDGAVTDIAQRSGASVLGTICCSERTEPVELEAQDSLRLQCQTFTE